MDVPTAVDKGGIGDLQAAVAAPAVGDVVNVALIRRRRVEAREERWAALVAGLGPGDEDSLTGELVRRRAGELAWRELNAELAVRARAITWLGWTGGWGRPPRDRKSVV